jgi:hypothetical protein
MIQGNPPKSLAYGYNATSGWMTLTGGTTDPAASEPPPTALYGASNGQFYPMQCDAQGNLAVSGLANPTTTYYLDGNRTDNYTPTGSIQFPFTTLDELSTGLNAYVAAGGTGPIAIWCNPASYSTLTVTSFPAIVLEIYGNNSTWTFVNGISTNGQTIIYDLNTIGNVTYNYAGTARSERHGGSYLGNITITGGYIHMYAVNLSGNSNTLTVNAFLYGEALTGSMKIASGGTSAFISLYNINMTKSSGYNIDMTAGGQLSFNAGLLSTASATYNIYLPTANLVTASHFVSGAIYLSGLGISASNSTYVVYDNLSLPPAALLAYGIYAPGRPGVFSGLPAATGYIGEVVSSKVAVGAAISLTTATPKNVTNISLTAGDWNVEGNVNYVLSGATTASGSTWKAGVNTTTGTLPTDGSEVYATIPVLTTASANLSATLPLKVINISSTTIVYLIAEATFTAGTASAYGTITARRAR